MRREWAACQLISFGARGPKASGSAPGSRGAGRAGCRPRPGPRRLLTRLPGYVGERLHSDFQAKRNSLTLRLGSEKNSSLGEDPFRCLLPGPMIASVRGAKTTLAGGEAAAGTQGTQVMMPPTRAPLSCLPGCGSGSACRSPPHLLPRCRAADGRMAVCCPRPYPEDRRSPPALSAAIKSGCPQVICLKTFNMRP